MPIQILNPDVINQIAAGEVVERPAHLVKELVENSLDAGSTQIHIEVAMGGRFIKVIDNGSGIEKNELELALTRHATSKISQTEDIWKLNTFGFRGEALASASAISRVQLLSKSHKADSAFLIKSEFGKNHPVILGQKTQGTEIRIEGLFENVPARLKFLKSDAAEFAQIKNTVKAMALVNPQVEFKLIENGDLSLFYRPQNSTLDRVKDVLNIKNLFYSKASREGYTTEAYYASPEDVAKTSKNIWIFAQNRWIQDRGLQAAVMEAYRNLLMHGEYPQCMVQLTCPTEDIDVNIHPTKSQVKFQSPSLAFRSVQAALRDGLEQAPWITRINPVTPMAHMTPSFTKPEPVVQENFKFEHPSFLHTTVKEKNYDMSQLESLKVNDQEIKYQLKTNLGYWSTFQVIGQVNLTYIVCQKDEKLILVDQHAAHERVAYEKLMSYWTNKETHLDRQNFLFPLAIDLNPEKIEALISQQSEIQNLGIELEILGPQTIGVKSGPLIVKDNAYAKVLDKMAQDVIDHGGSHRMERTISDVLATMACHSVVRAGQSLSLVEMKQLLIDMDQFPLSSFCPHGRPVSVEMTFTEIEKMFGRLGS